MSLPQSPTTTQKRRILSALQRAKTSTNQTQENNHREESPSDGRSFLGITVLQSVDFLESIIVPIRVKSRNPQVGSELTL
jgi:hypothetical protein